MRTSFPLWQGLFLSVLMGLASSAAVAKPKNGQQFKDWVTVCQAVPDTKNQHCHIAQTASKNIEGKGGKPPEILLHTMIGYMFGTKNPVAIFVIPDTKLDQKEKLELSFGEKIGINFDVKNCDKESCHAGIPVDNRILDAFKKGKVALFGYKRGGKDVQVPISLMGITAGLKALNSK